LCLESWAQVGDSVAAVLWTGGGFAEHVVALASNVIRLPGEA
jgi:D-arabinose 1-dehydrogenase-like Zn-dependent alcohol dehydrogenase